jgi:hypothetical protein
MNTGSQGPVDLGAWRVPNPKELNMKKCIALLSMALLLLAAAPASADLFAFDIQGQAGYGRISNIAPVAGEGTGALSGFSFGARGRLQVLFLTAIVDYQHFLDGAEFLHGGLGVYFSTDLIPVIRPYVLVSAGVMMLKADANAILPDTPAMNAKAGFQARAGGGLEIPFLGDWFAVGANVDFGYHYITGNHGYDLTVMGYLGLRI